MDTCSSSTHTSPEAGVVSTADRWRIVRGRETTHVPVQLPTLPRYHDR
jgi:hypothetical protein